MFNSLKINSKAPEFELNGYHNGAVSQFKPEQFLGKWLVLFFYPADWTGTCGSEVEAFEANYSKFVDRNVNVVSCSTDSPYTHQAWAKELGGVSYPMLSDSHHATCIDYNVFIEDAAMALRGTFIIDPEGKLQWYCISSTSIGRSTDEILRTIDALQSGNSCPANWQK